MGACECVFTAPDAFAGKLFSEVMSEEDREHLIQNIVGHLKNARRSIQERQLAHFFRAHADYGRRVREGLAKHWGASKL